ncbi:MAG: hypothetical protein WCX75_04780, partial [Fibrobacteraceae bacterium]
MWKTKGTVPYFLSVFAVTFVQMGCFVLTQKVFSATSSGEGFIFQSALLQGLFLLPYLFMMTP